MLFEISSYSRKVENIALGDFLIFQWFNHFCLLSACYRVFSPSVGCMMQKPSQSCCALAMTTLSVSMTCQGQFINILTVSHFYALRIGLGCSYFQAWKKV